MRIYATTKPVVVRYRSHNKVYTAGGGEVDQAGVGPFDEMTIPVGSAADLEDVSIVNIEELG